MNLFAHRIHKSLLMNIVYAAGLCLVFYLCGINLAYALLGIGVALYVYFLRKIKVNFTALVSVFILFLFSSFFIGRTLPFSPLTSPVIAFSILVTILFGQLELSFLLAIYFAFIAASFTENTISTVMIHTAGGLVASIISFNSRKRWQIIKAGLAGGIAALIFSMLMEGEKFTVDTVSSFLANGCLSAIVVLGTLPILEFLFKVVTNISLLELSDFNHPLLKKMILEAPGTYQHSLVVANLAEAAAEAIGANPLLSRVGAYYHDIGKISKAEYFVENQIPYKDMHKHLTPSMSTLVIMNHVKEGIELARKYKLNTQITDFVAQHHGTTLVYYFYQRAKHLEVVESEEQFRYPGPKPQTKEAALVHLADAVEAISRTLEDPSPSRIREMVTETIKNKFLEGQLDETDVTLKDLNRIGESFARILCAAFHTRIDYPKEE